MRAFVRAAFAAALVLLLSAPTIAADKVFKRDDLAEAAIKLEALGPDSRQPLRVGLQSDSPWVRFAAAEALAYLGHADGAKDLAELAEKHPATTAAACGSSAKSSWSRPIEP